MTTFGALFRYYGAFIAVGLNPSDCTAMLCGPPLGLGYGPLCDATMKTKKPLGFPVLIGNGQFGIQP